MDSGYYAACAGLAAQVQALDLIAHNMANLATAGYRGEEATFSSLLAGNNSIAWNPLNAAINNYGVLGGARVDLTPASLAPTGGTWDLGIEGGGFFAVQSTRGLRYTRNGSFHVTATGDLQTADGDAVLGEQGPINVPPGLATVSSDGTISVNGAAVAKVQLVEFARNADLTPAGNSLYSAPDNSALPAAGSSIREGMLEGSNVSPVLSTVELITVQRNAEMLQRALSLFDSQLDQTAVQDLPRV
jgi:flagellar basal-body rod protein FlgF